MDKAALVNLDIERGSELLNALDSARLKVGAALWVYLPEYEDWRLVVAGRQFDALDTREAYRALNDALTAAGFTPERTPPVMILPTGEPFIRALRRLFGKAKSVEGMRLGGQVIGDRYLQDAYVYRIS